MTKVLNFEPVSWYRKTLKRGSLGFLNYPLVAENQNKRGFFGDIENFGKKVSQCQKNSKSNFLSCLVTKKSFKNYGTFWKHKRLLSSKVGRPIEIL